jgi:hypothetical protein
MSENGEDDDRVDEATFAAALADRFAEAFDADTGTAEAAAERAAAFREDWDEGLTVDGAVEAVRAAGDAYDDFGDRFDLAVGEWAAAAEGCTDSREYRLAGFGDLAADPEQGA